MVYCCFPLGVSHYSFSRPMLRILSFIPPGRTASSSRPPQAPLGCRHRFSLLSSLSHHPPGSNCLQLPPSSPPPATSTDVFLRLSHGRRTRRHRFRRHLHTRRDRHRPEPRSSRNFPHGGVTAEPASAPTVGEPKEDVGAGCWRGRRWWELETIRPGRMIRRSIGRKNE
eukprot:SAG11_NODE_16719_length_539_cov_1.413636_1_plen_169_part_10